MTALRELLAAHVRRQMEALVRDGPDDEPGDEEEDE